MKPRSARPQPLTLFGRADGISCVAPVPYCPGAMSAVVSSRVALTAARAGVGEAVRGEPLAHQRARPGRQRRRHRGAARVDVVRVGLVRAPEQAAPGSVAACDLSDTILVPGATISGLARPSSVGPREEKAAMPLALLDGGSVAIGCVRSRS